MEHHCQSFSLGLSAPPHRLETALTYIHTYIHTRGMIGAPKSAQHAFFTNGQILRVCRTLVLNTWKCYKKVSKCPGWSLTALLILFQLFKDSGALFLAGSTCFFGQPSITPLHIYIHTYILTFLHTNMPSTEYLMARQMIWRISKQSLWFRRYL